MKVWVDSMTGTYGNFEDLIFADIPDDILNDWDIGGATDSTIVAVAREHRLPNSQLILMKLAK